jgi:hypothetical protein
MLTIPHCLDIRFIDQMAMRLSASRAGSALLPRSIFNSVLVTHFCYSLNKAQGLMRPKTLDKLQTFNYIIVNSSECAGYWNSVI